MSDKFRKALKEVILNEGGYSNHPDDKGGETMYGITKKKAVENGYTGPMKDLPMSITEKIYKKDYWRSEFEDFHTEIATFLFDMNVNHGYKGMSTILQRSINLLTKDNINVDGIAGKVTYSKALGLNQERLFFMLFSYRCKYFIDITEKNESQESFIFGWLKNRVWNSFIRVFKNK
ncbi:MAG: glycoside hydrolase family 108 protein [Cetobacterium sp.]|uniref:glycoside hydrolase family 108 protein n=1 Tax=Cetobacterium sp. TaxID=2071632 RepID=UPI003F2B03C4